MQTGLHRNVAANLPQSHTVSAAQPCWWCVRWWLDFLSFFPPALTMSLRTTCGSFFSLQIRIRNLSGLAAWQSGIASASPSSAPCAICRDHHGYVRVQYSSAALRHGHRVDGGASAAFSEVTYRRHCAVAIMLVVCASTAWFLPYCAAAYSSVLRPGPRAYCRLWWCDSGLFLSHLPPAL